jgi:hypothetical protein
MMQVHISPVFLALDAGPNHLHYPSMKHTIPSSADILMQVRVDMLTLCIGEYCKRPGVAQGVVRDEAPLRMEKHHMRKQHSARVTGYRKNCLLLI